jgi:hypothetical protein
MGRRNRVRQVEIFNFSFLDILACTIGLLIFIMVMVFILQSNSPVADTGAIINAKTSEVASLTATTARDAAIAQGLESQFDQMHVPNQPDLSPQRDAARAARDAARTNYEIAVKRADSEQTLVDQARLARARSMSDNLNKLKADLRAAQEQYQRAAGELADAIAAAKVNSVVFEPRQRPGEPPKGFQVLHVDCHADKVIMYKEADGKMSEVGETLIVDLGDGRSVFQSSVAAYGKLDDGIVLFWVRPDAQKTFAAAQENLPKATNYGFEPADANWSFDSKPGDKEGTQP